MKSQDDVRFGEEGGSNWENATRLWVLARLYFLTQGQIHKCVHYVIVLTLYTSVHFPI